MPRKRRRGRPGDGSVYWSASQQRYVGEVTLGRDERGVRVRRVIVGPRGEKGDDARLGLKDRLERLQPKRVARGRSASVSSRTRVGEYLDGWLKTKTNLSDSAAANYDWAIEQHIKPGLGTLRLRDLRRKHVKDFLGDLALSDHGKAKVRTVLRSALADAVKDEDNPLIDVNPAAGRDLLPKKHDLREVAVWNAEQALQFLKVAKETPYYSLFLVAIVGALGPAELFGIRWKDIDLKNGRVAIVANLTEVEGRLVLKETKTASRRRSVVLPRVARAALKARYKAVKPSPNDFVFTAPEGGGIRRTTFGARVWRPLIKKAKVPVITLYGLRHSAASLMAAMGVPLLVASRALGHSNIRTTANTYTHLFEESQREVADKFDRFLREL